jgi:hypothetical protein
MPSGKQGIGEWNKTQMRIIYRVTAEIMTGKTVGSTYVSQAMQHGIDTEAEARIAFELETGMEVQTVGFVEWNEWIGCSPDGLIPDSGLEIKCPQSDTHLRYLNSHADLSADYEWQCIGGMLCAGVKTWHLYSFDPRFSDSAHQSLHVTINYDEEKEKCLIARLGQAIIVVRSLIERMGGAPFWIAKKGENPA